jgi:hypothetical protein
MQRLQRAGYELAHVHLAWKAANRGGSDHLEVENEAYRTAKATGIEEVTINAFSSKNLKPGEKAKRMKGQLVGLRSKVAYVSVGGQVVTFSLSHGRPCYGSQQRFRGRMSSEDVALLFVSVTEITPMEKILLEVLGNDEMRLRELTNEVGRPKATCYHALERLVRRRLVTRGRDKLGHVTFRKEQDS